MRRKWASEGQAKKVKSEVQKPKFCKKRSIAFKLYSLLAWCVKNTILSEISKQCPERSSR